MFQNSLDGNFRQPDSLLYMKRWIVFSIISKKPIDHPFGPYADSFSEQQHKLGPFGPIKEYREKNKH